MPRSQSRGHVGRWLCEGRTKIHNGPREIPGPSAAGQSATPDASGCLFVAPPVLQVEKHPRLLSGLVGARLTEIPGSSDVFEGGVVCYSYESKTAMLDVPANLIKEHGAVSEPVARAMAEGVLARLGGHLSVAVTGIAGPGGGMPDKPVGTVWFATAMDGDVRATKNIFMGSRAEVRARAAQRALFLLWKRLPPAVPPTPQPC